MFVEESFRFFACGERRFSVSVDVYKRQVLNGSDNSVIGWSTNTGTTAAGINLTFSFSSLDGSPPVSYTHLGKRIF